MNTFSNMKKLFISVLTLGLMALASTAAFAQFNNDDDPFGSTGFGSTGSGFGGDTFTSEFSLLDVMGALGAMGIYEGDGFGTIMTWEEWEEMCTSPAQWECAWAWEDPLVMAQMLGGAGYDGVGSYYESDPCGGVDCVIATGQINQNRGHDFRTTNVVCQDASLLSLADLQATIGWFTIPRQTGSLVDARTLGPEDQTLVTTSIIGIPGGWVTTEILEGGLTGINTVVENRHFLAGRVTRTLIETPSGQLAIATVGIGVSNAVLIVPLPGGGVITIPLGEYIDAGNEPVGRNVFNAFDNLAAASLRSQFPGC